jgi:hypothetical protein
VFRPTNYGTTLRVILTLSVAEGEGPMYFVCSTRLFGRFRNPSPTLFAFFRDITLATLLRLNASQGQEPRYGFLSLSEVRGSFLGLRLDTPSLAGFAALT